MSSISCVSSIIPMGGNSIRRDIQTCKVISIDRYKLHSASIDVKKIALLVTVGDSKIFINPMDILYAQAHSNYCKIYLKCGNSYLVAKTLKKITEQLPKALFIRCHQSYIVNINHISQISGSSKIEITTNQGNKIIPISRRRKTEVINRLTAIISY